MQRPSVYVGVPEPSSGYLSKASPRHASPAYAATEIVEEPQVTGHVKPALKKSVWSMKPEETVHLIPLVLVLSGLIVSLPTFYNAYQGKSSFLELADMALLYPSCNKDLSIPGLCVLEKPLFPEVKSLFLDSWGSASHGP